MVRSKQHNNKLWVTGKEVPYKIMLRFLPAWCIGLISLSLYLVNCFVIGTIILVLALFKVIPNKTWQGYCSQVLVLIGVFWVDINSFNIRFTKKIKWDIQGLDGLNPGGWYLVISNHRTWADILVLQKVFNHRIPFLKFFVKQQLLWLPLLGQVWWAMDFPFMKRYSREFLKKHPELEGKDVETTRRACEKFKFHPISIMNFVEGTRFTPEKHQKQNSAYRNLLQPKAGGIAFVLSAMGASLNSIINVTIVYSNQNVSFWDFISGKIQHVTVRVQQLPIPDEFLLNHYSTDPVFQKNFQDWVNQLWQEKDRQIEQLTALHATHD